MISGLYDWWAYRRPTIHGDPRPYDLWAQRARRIGHDVTLTVDLTYSLMDRAMDDVAGPGPG